MFRVRKAITPPRAAFTFRFSITWRASVDFLELANTKLAAAE
jgi:hypothetical protein